MQASLDFSQVRSDKRILSQHSLGKQSGCKEAQSYPVEIALLIFFSGGLKFGKLFQNTKRSPSQVRSLHFWTIICLPLGTLTLVWLLWWLLCLASLRFHLLGGLLSWFCCTPESSQFQDAGSSPLTHAFFCFWKLAENKFNWHITQSLLIFESPENCGSEDYRVNYFLEGSMTLYSYKPQEAVLRISHAWNKAFQSCIVGLFFKKILRSMGVDLYSQALHNSVFCQQWTIMTVVL